MNSLDNVLQQGAADPVLLDQDMLPAFTWSSQIPSLVVRHKFHP